MNRKATYNEGWQSQRRGGLMKTNHIAVEDKTTPFATSHVISSYKEHATSKVKTIIRHFQYCFITIQKYYIWTNQNQ